MKSGKLTVLAMVVALALLLPVLPAAADDYGPGWGCCNYQYGACQPCRIRTVQEMRPVQVWEAVTTYHEVTLCDPCGRSYVVVRPQTQYKAKTVNQPVTVTYYEAPNCCGGCNNGCNNWCY